jgi:predicted small secreted protein
MTDDENDIATGGRKEDCTMRRSLIIVATLLVTALSLTACADDSGKGDDAATSGSGSTTVDITIKDGKVTPNGDRIKAKVGEPVTLKIDADTAGEIHVHSTPEQEIEFEKGTSTKKLTIDKPGIIDVEDHALEQVIVQLEVS